MSLIENRPELWSKVIGQEKPLKFLRGLFQDQRRTPKGFVFEGSSGVGKTSVSCLLARALSCVNHLFEGDSCASCATDQEQHPDILMFDAASKSSVVDAREIVDSVSSYPVLGKSRVVIVDEAQRLSREAWDVYLKPLEDPAINCYFIFITTEYHKIPNTIKNRCCRIPFERPKESSIVGFLTSIAARDKIDYDQAGLVQIARKSRGQIREAVKTLDTLASIGKITKELVTEFVRPSETEQAYKILGALAKDDYKRGLELIDELNLNAQRVVDLIFKTYSLCVFAHDEPSESEARVRQAILNSFSDQSKTTTVLLRWSQASSIPFEALSIFLIELAGTRAKTDTSSPRSEYKQVRIENKESKTELVFDPVRDYKKIAGGRLKLIG